MKLVLKIFAVALVAALAVASTVILTGCRSDFKWPAKKASETEASTDNGASEPVEMTEVLMLIHGMSAYTPFKYENKSLSKMVVKSPFNEWIEKFTLQSKTLKITVFIGLTSTNIDIKRNAEHYQSEKNNLSDLKNSYIVITSTGIVILDRNDNEINRINFALSLGNHTWEINSYDYVTIDFYELQEVAQ